MVGFFGLILHLSSYNNNDPCLVGSRDCCFGCGLVDLPASMEACFAFAVIFVIMLAILGVAYGFLAATVAIQRIWQRHYHILTKKELTKASYITCLLKLNCSALVICSEPGKESNIFLPLRVMAHRNMWWRTSLGVTRRRRWIQSMSSGWRCCSSCSLHFRRWWTWNIASFLLHCMYVLLHAVSVISWGKHVF